MFLTKEEERMLNGEHGEAAQKAMEILVALGKIYGAEKMIPVSSVQVAGVSYKTMGDAGLEFIEEFACMGAKVKVPTFINPAGMDKMRWKEMGVPEEFAQKQIRLMNAYESMGITPTYTCAPYHSESGLNWANMLHGQNQTQYRLQTQYWAHGPTGKVGLLRSQQP